MSAYREQKTQIKDKDCLIEALKAKGYTAEYHENGDNLVGYHGDKRKDTAEVIIRRKQIGSASNDIGFKKAEDGTYQAIISDYDRGKHNDKWLTSLIDDYAEKKIAKIAKTKGLKYIGTSTDKDGNKQVRYRKLTA